jgi:hypothetical protein
VAHVVECLPSKHEALSSNHSTAKKKKKTKQTGRATWGKFQTPVFSFRKDQTQAGSQ